MNYNSSADEVVSLTLLCEVIGQIRCDEDFLIKYKKTLNAKRLKSANQFC